MFKTVHHFLVIYIFLKDQSLDYYNKFSVSGGSTSDTPWYLEEGKKKKRCRMSSCSSALCHEEQHTYCSKAHFSQGEETFGGLSARCQHRFLGALGTTISCPPTVGTSRTFLQFLPHSSGSNSTGLVVNTKYCSTKHCAKT